MFPVRSLAFLVLMLTAALAQGQTSPTSTQNTQPPPHPVAQNPQGSSQQSTVPAPVPSAAPAQAAPVASQPETKILIPESDAAAANSPVESNDPLLSVPPMPKGK